MNGSRTLVVAGSSFVSLVLFLGGDLAYTRLSRLEPTGNPATRSADFDHTFVPNFAGYRVWGPNRYFFATNSLGFADRAPRVVSLKSAAYRIMFLGDSFTEGVGIPYDATFVGLFAEALKRRQVEVLNAAVSSYSPRLYYAKLKYFLDRGLKIDELFVFVDISDIQDEAVWNRDGVPWGAYSTVIDPYTLAVRQPQPDRSLGGLGIGAWAATNMRITSAAYGLIKDMKTGRKRNALGLPETVRGSWTVDRGIFDSWGREGLNTCGEYMSKVADLCRVSHIKLRVAVYPWRQQIENNDLNSLQVKYWQAFCAERGIPFLNYFPDFIGRGDSGRVVDDFFIRGDMHWNRAGHRKVAARLIDTWKN